VCGVASKHYTHEVPVKVCEGSAAYGSLPHGAVIAEHWQCVGCPDLQAIATAIEDLVNCVTENPEDFAEDVLGAIAEYMKNLAQLGNPAAALAAMDPGTVALLIDDICTCLGGGCDPCNYVICEKGSFSWQDVTDLYYLTGGPCP